MSLLLKPHTLAVYAVSQTKDANDVVQVPTYAVSPVNITGQLTPESASAVYERTLVTLVNPHMFMFDLADIGSIKKGDKCVKGTRTFEVMTRPTQWDAESSTSCAVAYLEEREFI